jgi:hypothetical protein
MAGQQPVTRPRRPVRRFRRTFAIAAAVLFATFIAARSADGAARRNALIGGA